MRIFKSPSVFPIFVLICLFFFYGCKDSLDLGDNEFVVTYTDDISYCTGGKVVLFQRKDFNRLRNYLYNENESPDTSVWEIDARDLQGQYTAGQQIIIKIRKEHEDEMFICLAIYRGYPGVFILEERLK